MGEEDWIQIDGNKEITNEEGQTVEIVLSDLKVVGTLG